MHCDEQFYSSIEKLKNVIEPRGFEVYPLKVGWYNDVVADTFKLNVHYDTPACVILSTPCMFEKTFKPFVKDNLSQDQRMHDPIDLCISEVIRHSLEVAAPQLDVEVLHDYDMDAHHKPKVLVQTAAHVAGAAYYYQPKDVTEDASKKLKVGLCIHRRYGGWFAIRAVIVFKSLKCTGLERTAPPDVVPLQADKVRMLEAYNRDWKDWTYRDIIPVEARYSEQQKLYFSTLPKNRIQLLQQLMDEGGW